MSEESIGDRVERQAIAQFQTMTVTGKLSHRDDQRRTFIVAYMAGYLQSHQDITSKVERGMK